jgi:hypothetical protein
MLLNWLTFHVDKIGGFPLHGCLAPSFAADQTARFHQLYPFGGGDQRTFSLPFLDPRRHGQKSHLHVDGFFSTRFKEWNANLISISLQKFALPIQITNFTMHIRRLNKLLMIATIKYLG